MKACCVMPYIEKRYREALASIPAPGGGGCHTALLGVASLAIMAGRSDTEALAEIKSAIPHGRRRVSDKEIADAIRRAHLDTVRREPGTVTRRPIPPPKRDAAAIRSDTVKEEAATLRRDVLAAGGDALDPFGADVWEASPIRIEAHSERYPYVADMVALLENLYSPEDVIFIGRQHDAEAGNVKPVCEWLALFREELARIDNLPPEAQRRAFLRLGERYPYIIPNPHTGHPGATKSGDKESWRADACIASFRFIVAEFDGMPFEQQGAILRGLCKAGARLAALIYSGGKSCHAWLRVDGVSTAEAWKREVRDGLFGVLAALGVDKACSNPSRLSRLPGIFRANKGNWQRLLYLAPEGGAL